MRINSAIEVDKVMVISEEGEQLGVMPISNALSLSSDAGLDLVEVSPNVVPPVCKLMDYGKFVYVQDKKEKKNKKESVQTKELRFRPNIQDHDIQVKVNHARKFLTKGKKVRLVMQFKYREASNVNTLDKGQGVLEYIANELKDVCFVEKEIDSIEEGITTTLAPN